MPQIYIGMEYFAPPTKYHLDAKNSVQSTENCSYTVLRLDYLQELSLWKYGLYWDHVCNCHCPEHSVGKMLYSIADQPAIAEIES